MSTKVSSDATTASAHHTPFSAARAASQPPIEIATETLNNAASSAERTEFTREVEAPVRGEAHGEHRGEGREPDDHERPAPELAGDGEHQQPRRRHRDHVARDEDEPQSAAPHPLPASRRLDRAVGADLLRMGRRSEPPTPTRAPVMTWSPTLREMRHETTSPAALRPNPAC